jgi:hypothetical protein
MRKLTLAAILVALLSLFPSRARGLEEITYDEFMNPGIPKKLIVETTKGKLYWQLKDGLLALERGQKVLESYLNGIWTGNFSFKPIAHADSFSVIVDWCPGGGGLKADPLPGSAIYVVPGEVIPKTFVYSTGQYGHGLGVVTSGLVFPSKSQTSNYPPLAVNLRGYEKSNARVVRSLTENDSIRGITIERMTVDELKQASGNQNNAGVAQNGNYIGNFNISGQPFDLYYLGDAAFEFSLYDLLMQDGIYRRDSLHESFDENEMSRFWTSLGYRTRFAKFLAVQLTGLRSDNKANQNIGDLVLDVDGRKIPPYTTNRTISGAVMQGPRFWKAVWNFFNPGMSTSFSIGREPRTFVVPFLLDDESQGSGGRYRPQGLGSFSEGLEGYEIGIRDAIPRIYDSNGQFIELRNLPEINHETRRVSLR